MNSKLKCDEAGCGWTQEVIFPEIPKWHGVACPSCDKGEIVSHADMAMWKIISAVMEFDKQLDTGGTGGKVELVIDTAMFRQ
jgi:hypothetical protein